ncbi:MAG: 16S rRNA (guanine(527)-N(7))-methyltransferase RsmG [Clostridia bacterium]|nr:16S rRNA (guanine(527)-N(7))-methyltransferase RsmG [Clostridia bacterium]MBN2883647.1 16S rRNA (guanine(527)-N(7))-methyltransferase RsmG [Clostridia bacterium]
MSKILETGFAQAGIPINSEIIEKFEAYKRMLLEWNEKFNLTSITDQDDIDILHFLDSATIWNDVRDIERVADVGSGAGFPGIPLKILGMKGEMYLFDSLNKRISFLEAVIRELDLKGCHAIHSRAEDAGHGEYREMFDVSTARAVANLSVLSEYCLPLVKKGGVFIAMKGRDNEDEIKNSLSAIAKLGGSHMERREVSLYGTDAKRTLIYIRKTGITPALYPRKAGTPSKRPL